MEPMEARMVTAENFILTTVYLIPVKVMRTRGVEGFEVCGAPKTIFRDENAFSRGASP